MCRSCWGLRTLPRCSASARRGFRTEAPLRRRTAARTAASSISCVTWPRIQVSVTTRTLKLRHTRTLKQPWHPLKSSG